MKFAIVVLTHDEPETTHDCLKSVLSLRPRDYPEKNVFVVHNGTLNETVLDLQTRYNRFHHVVLSENVGFAAGANAGLKVAFQHAPWVLFLTQDCMLVHFPKSPPFEPCMAAVKVYKRKQEIVGSVGGAVDLELGQAYFCRQAKDFWRSFEDATLQPFVPRTAFWIHQTTFEKTNGFDEQLFSQWEDIDLSIRIRKSGELLQLDEGTEILHTRKGLLRQDPYYRSYLYTRNRLLVCRRYLADRWSRLRFEVGMIAESFATIFRNITKKRFADIGFFFSGFRDSFLMGRPPLDEKTHSGKTKSKIKVDAKTKTKTKTKSDKTKTATKTEKSVSAGTQSAVREDSLSNAATIVRALPTETMTKKTSGTDTNGQ